MSPSEPHDGPRQSLLRLIRLGRSQAAGAGPAARLGGITATIVLLVPSQGPSWEIAFYRLGEVALGTLCAIAVGWLASFIQTRVMRDLEEAPDAQA